LKFTYSAAWRCFVHGFAWALLKNEKIQVSPGRAPCEKNQISDDDDCDDKTKSSEEKGKKGKASSEGEKKAAARRDDRADLAQ